MNGCKVFPRESYLTDSLLDVNCRSTTELSWLHQHMDEQRRNLCCHFFITFSAGYITSCLLSAFMVLPLPGSLSNPIPCSDLTGTESTVNGVDTRMSHWCSGTVWKSTVCALSFWETWAKIHLPKSQGNKLISLWEVNYTSKCLGSWVVSKMLLWFY